MKLLTHNMLTSKAIKGVQTGFPLNIVVKKTKTVETEFSSEFIQRMLPKLDWPAFLKAAQTLGVGSQLPDSPPTETTDETVLRSIHHALVEVEVIEGELICPETERKFPISNGIPNMLLNEDEI
ncbi:multifunctional methyltransferase subunit TRM112-like protein [Galendromus occidentalis]|uniref:Multifunctional methyltransferase subunit TRM112-like protein n=1 Tax=Galendromus occidentalis TaxID=34638 RepID=A0AAJ6QL17_9ACAR|nr:multifunctional methyltransferase subunit TRM112-like protein [Galendromus occidentalis]